ncbi:hypothetical protein [Streptomyces sp. NPDC006285]|uniref:hypothetical protein n=1 Tax=Streptomyces sp. NPDC006285 TaxID=3364742 RepID=UPI00367AC59B
MEAELAVLATSGATAIVQLMAQDAWVTTKDRVLALFGGRGRNGVEAVEPALDETRAVAAGGDDMCLAELASQWQARLLVLLQQDPAAADQVRALVAGSPDQTGSVHNVISGGEMRGPVVQTRTINGGLHFG